MQEFVREFACRILLDIQHAAGVRRIQAATRIPPSPLVKLAGFENVEGCGYKGLGFASRFRVWGCGFLLGLGWVEGVEFEGVLGGRVERVGKMMGRWKNS